MSVTFAEMVNQSVSVIAKPSVTTFELYEKRGTMRDAALLIAASSAIVGLLSFGLGAGGMIAAVIVALVGFFAFTYLVHFIAKQQGGTGTLDEVAYSFALFWAPLGVVGAVATLLLGFLGPIIALAQLAANVYFAYLAIQSSMNFSDSSKIWTTLGGAVIGYIVIFFVLTALIVTPLVLMSSGMRFGN
jgi:Yip1 domain